MRAGLICVSLSLLAGCASKKDPAPGGAWFKEAAAEAGLNFRHDPHPSGKFYMPEIMGAGVAVLDFDNDGDLDVYLVQGMPLEGSADAGTKAGNRMFRNNLVETGKLTFTDVTQESGTGAVMYGMGAATGDFDNDGHVDLYVTAFGRNVLYRNLGGGKFQDITAAAGVQDERWSTSAAFVDYDRDGDLDLVVLNYVDFTISGNKQCFAPSGEPDYCTPKAYRPVTAKLFRNEGGGKFKDVTAAAGIDRASGPGLGVTCADVNGDGWIDIYVANDTAANLLWMNQKNGTFQEDGLMSGAAYSEDGLAKAGMGVAAGDFDNDSDEDLFVVNLTREGATLFQNDGRGGYQDVSLRYQVRPLTFAYTGFGTDWFDFDNDGWLDLFISNGAVTLMEELRGSKWPFQQKNILLRNESGTKFVDVTEQGGAALALKEVSRGAAFGDMDNDGDVDIVVSNNDGPTRLLLNEATGKRAWIAAQLEGVQSNRMALGARVGVVRKDGKTLWRRVRTDSSYLSASDPRVHFGLGGEDAVREIIVEWPGGQREKFAGSATRKFVRLKEGTGRR